MQSRLKTRTSLLVLIFVVLGIYYPAIFSPINSVDDSGMIQYLLNTDTFTFREIFLPGGSGTYFRPLLLSSFVFDKYVWGLDESFMHLDNIFFHLCNTLMVFALARRAALLQGARSSTVPLLAALFFALHPVNAEAVNWISGRTDLLSGFFLFLSAFLLMRFPGRVAGSACAALSMLAACLVKETAIFILPALLILPFFLPVDRPKRSALLSVARRNLLHFFFFLAAGCGYFAFRALAFNRGDSGVARVMSHVAGEQGAGLRVTLRLVFKAAGFYLKKLLIPFPLNFGIIHVSDWYLPVGLLAAILVLWQLKRQNLSAFFFICAFSVACSALMIPLLRVTWTPLGERYMYIPSAFFLLGISLAALQWESGPRKRAVVSAAVILLLAVSAWGTSRRTLLWQDNLALYRDTLRKSPDFAPAQNEIANALYARGDRQKAAVIYKSFVPDDELINAQYGLMNKAFAFTQEKDFTTARKVLKQALANPGKFEIPILKQMLEVNNIEVQQGRAEPLAVYADNVQALNRLLVLTGDPFLQYRLGVVELQAGHREEALQSFRKVVAKAAPGTYYLKPAQQLCATLAATLDRNRAGGGAKK